MDELYKNLVKLKPKDNVPFKCIGCGECCKHVKEQVPVETLDAFRIARYLMEQDKSITCMDDFWKLLAFNHINRRAINTGNQITELAFTFPFPAPATTNL